MLAMFDKALHWVDKNLLVLLLIILAMRGLFLFTIGLDLIGDESYYWDWSRQPAWCYYSKPPMVAWLIGAVTWLLGDYTPVVRLPALLLGTVFLAYFHATAKAFYGAQAAALALLLILATPINAIANFLMTIDPPLYCFWIMALYYLRRALFDADHRAWLWAGCVNAAALLSKQAALALPVMLLIFLLIERGRRSYLKRYYWLYLMPMIFAALPILWWNQQHDWVMFAHSKGHFGNHEPIDWLKRLQHARDFVLYQLLLLSPVTFGLSVVISFKGAVGFKRLTAEQQFLWLMGPLLILAVLLLCFLQKTQGNWSMPFYISALILLVGDWAATAWRKVIKWALGVGFFMVGTTYMLPFLLQMFDLKGSAFDPTQRFKSWQETALRLHAERLAVQPDLTDTFVVALGHRYLASQLAFYLPDHPKVYRFEESGKVISQYEVWPGPYAFVGKNAFVVGEGQQKNPPHALKHAFAHFRFLAEIPNPNNAKSPYWLYWGENLIAWPGLAERTR